jgi:hypothetical protein
MIASIQSSISDDFHLLGSSWPCWNSNLGQCCDSGMCVVVLLVDGAGVCGAAINVSVGDGVTRRQVVFGRGALATFTFSDLEIVNCLSCCQSSSACFPTTVRSVLLD